MSKREKAATVRTILFPTDGSPESEMALKVAIALAKACAFPITFLSVTDDAPRRGQAGEAARTGAGIPSDAGRREDSLQTLAQRTVQAADVPYTTVVRRGDPAEEIVAAAAQDVQYIVMLTHGRSGLARWRLGSVADKVMRAAPVPTVLVCPLEEVELGRLEKILIPLDGSPLSEAALPEARSAAQASGAAIVLVRAVPHATPQSGFDGTAAELNEWARQEPLAYLTAIAQQFEGHSVSTQVLTADPVAAIVEAAATVDLIVMASHGRGGLSRLALGSVAAAVIRRAGKPVMVIRGRSDSP